MEDWWHQDGATGYVHPSLLLPDPDQPRKIIAGGDWVEFIASLETSGVREYIRVTPRTLAPWVEVPKDCTCPFIIVSGHRRHKGAIEVDLEASPIVIKIYPNEESYRADADELNVGRKDLSPLEEAIEIGRRRNLGHTWEKISQSRVMTTQTCLGRYRLLNLAPDIQALVDPVARQGRRSEFPINVAQALGSLSELTASSFIQMVEKYDLGTKLVVLEEEGDEKLDFALQRSVLAQIQTREMSSVQAIEYITNGRRHKSGNTQTPGQNERSHAKRLRALDTTIKGPTKAVTVNLNRPDLRSACSELSVADVNLRIEWTTKSIAELTRLNEMLQSIRDAKIASAKQLTSPPLFTDKGTSILKVNPEGAAAIAARYGATIKQ
jgi:hypothetical protein